MREYVRVCGFFLVFLSSFLVFSFCIEWFGSPVLNEDVCWNSYRSWCEVSVVFWYMMWMLLVKTDFTVLEVCSFCFFCCRFQYNGQSITVQEYFTRVKGVQLQYPYLPCLAVGSANRESPIHLPPEVRNNFISNWRMILLVR